MKKTYIMPEALTVEFGTKASILQTSLPVVNGAEEIDDPSQILTKENKNLWDEEW